MELNDLIPYKNKPMDCKWVIKNNYLMYKKFDYIPLAYIDKNDCVIIILENKLRKEVIKLTKHLIKLNCEFYYSTPEITDPSGVENIEEKTINHYLYSYSQSEFFKEFNKLNDKYNFDIINNMVKWSIKNNSYSLIKDSYFNILKTVKRKNYDWYSNKDYYDYDIDIRNKFDSLYRDIQISQLIS